jgi:hypothetical protein
MKLLEAIASEDLRVAYRTRWLIIERDQYYVYELVLKKATPLTLYAGSDEEIAVKFLLEGNASNKD